MPGLPRPLEVAGTQLTHPPSEATALLLDPAEGAAQDGSHQQVLAEIQLSSPGDSSRHEAEGEDTGDTLPVCNGSRLHKALSPADSIDLIIQGDMTQDNLLVRVCAVYGPVERAQRQALWARLKDFTTTPGLMYVVLGDFHNRARLEDRCSTIPRVSGETETGHRRGSWRIPYEYVQLKSGMCELDKLLQQHLACGWDGEQNAAKNWELTKSQIQKWCRHRIRR
uniref:Uncharacterized protein n=1 Tax=Sphaerodactylus townsendi TaxID=933632 RepID=A0ACB8FGI5_9SAUR